MSPRARRLRRQRREHGKPCGAGYGILMRHFCIYWVDSARGPRLRRVVLGSLDGNVARFDARLGDWVYSANEDHIPRH